MFLVRAETAGCVDVEPCVLRRSVRRTAGAPLPGPPPQTAWGRENSIAPRQPWNCAGGGPLPRPLPARSSRRGENSVPLRTGPREGHAPSRSSPRDLPQNCWGRYSDGPGTRRRASRCARRGPSPLVPRGEGRTRSRADTLKARSLSFRGRRRAEPSPALIRGADRGIYRPNPRGPIAAPPSPPRSKFSPLSRDSGGGGRGEGALSGAVRSPSKRPDPSASPAARVEPAPTGSASSDTPRAPPGPARSARRRPPPRAPPRPGWRRCAPAPAARRRAASARRAGSGA